MINKDNTLIILHPSGRYPQKLYTSMTKLGFKVCRSMKGNDKYICRALRSIIMKYDTKLQVFMYGKWYKEELKKYENVLIFHDKYSYPIVNILQNKKKYQGMIYLYYMDPMETDGAKDCNFIRVKPNEHFKIYSFEKNDCKEYGYHYNSLFFFKEDVRTENEYWSDVFFIGTDKGRLEHLLSIQKVLEKEGINIDMHICRYGRKASKYAREIGYRYKKPIPYEKLLMKLMHTRCVLDIAPENQEEVTLRVYEAIFCKKKVITNNPNVRKYQFYDRNNIFIMGEDSESELKAFVMGEFIESEKTRTIWDMDFERWVERFV